MLITYKNLIEEILYLKMQSVKSLDILDNSNYNGAILWTVKLPDSIKKGTDLYNRIMEAFDKNILNWDCCGFNIKKNWIKTNEFQIIYRWRADGEENLYNLEEMED